jgi:uncharacterized membrane protein
MIKKAPIKITMIFFLSVVSHFSSQSQNHKYFIINGKIIPELNANGNSSVQITKNNQKAVSFQIPEDDRFRLELEYNAEYTLLFSKKGNQQKTIIINTEIPENLTNSTPNFPKFLMAVKLYAGNPDSQNQYPENQIQHISYSTQKDCFVKTPTMLDVEYVEKGNSTPNLKSQFQGSKVKLQEYQVF